MQSRNRFPRSLIGAASIALVILPGMPTALAESAPAPSVRIVVASNAVTLRSEGGRVYLDLGVYAAATGGAFELQARRTDFTLPINITQVDDQGNVLRTLPSTLPANWRGLKSFSTVTFENADGTVVLEKPMKFCPNNDNRQRLNDDGPQVESYPWSCGGSHFPFTKGTVWGIDEGWAVDLLTGGWRSRYVRLAPGTYKVDVAIAPAFAEFFEIPVEDASVELDVTVLDGGGGDYRRHLGGQEEPRRPLTAVPTVTDPDPSTLPDLAALPAWRMRARSNRGRDRLTFASSPWNAGPAPLVIEGFRRPGEDIMDAYQYFYDSEGNVTGRAPVGEFDYDHRNTHEHWHFKQFAEFRVLDASGTRVVRSKKQAFCLVPTDAVDLTVEGARYRPDGRLGTQCGGPRALWVREVLDAGWADTYYQYVAGQSFNITNLPNGWYQVEVEVDPLKSLYQRSTANDSERRWVKISGAPGKRRVIAAPWNGITR